MVFRLLQGIGTAFGNVCCLAIVADALPKKKFNTGIGYYSVAQVVSQAIGPTIGLQLVSWFGYNNTYIINAGVMMLALVTASMIHIPARPHKPFKMKLHNIIAKEALVPTAVTFFVGNGVYDNQCAPAGISKKTGSNGTGLDYSLLLVRLQCL